MRIIYRTLFYLVSVCFYLPAICQDIKRFPATNYPEFNLRTSLNSWFDYDAGLMIGIGYRWSKSFSASFEPTWILYRGYTTEEGARPKVYPSGIKIRADMKFFPIRRKYKQPNFFLAPEFHYKQVATKMQGTFGINCAGGQCAFFQNAWFTQKKNEIGGLFKMGMVIPLLKADQRWLLEFYGGFGLKFRKIREVDIPTGASPRTRVRSLWFNIEPEDPIPLIPGGLKLLFKLENKD